MLEELHKYTVLFLLRTTILSPYLPICNSALRLTPLFATAPFKVLHNL